MLAKLNVSNDGKITIGEESVVAKTPVIPNGFEYLEGTVDTGYVIKNKTDGNEFVWVPVIAGTFTREGFGTDLSEYSEPYEEPGYTSEKAEYDAMVASVEKYGGFYIGRYEASETSHGSGIAQSKGDKESWVDIAWCDTGMTGIGTNGVVGKARAVYPAKDATTEGDAISMLPYGVQWDATVRWIRDSKEEYKNITSDSSKFGNYVDSETDEGSRINTGSNPAYVLNNIYDMAGNVWEWTMEVYYSDYRVFRGGVCFQTGSNASVSDRFYDYPEYGNSVHCGFRLALYIK